MQMNSRKAGQLEARAAVGSIIRLGALSPRNSKVRLQVRLMAASRLSFPNTYTRQQERAAKKPWKKFRGIRWSEARDM